MTLQEGFLDIMGTKRWDVLVSIAGGSPIRTTTYFNPYDGDPQKGILSETPIYKYVYMFICMQITMYIHRRVKPLYPSKSSSR